jgi:predicted nucleic acid-binding protein
MPFVVVYDANALYGNAQRDLLIRVAQSGLVQAKWTDQILDEMLSNLAKKRPDIPAEKLGTLRELMNKAVRDCLVTGYEPLIESLRLPDPDDRHVLAAAIKSSAQVIVTTNLRHFPEAELRRWNVEAKSPMTSCSTRSTSTRGSSIPASARSPTPGGTRRTRLTTYLRNWSGQAWCSLSLLCVWDDLCRRGNEDPVHYVGAGGDHRAEFVAVDGLGHP